jgi:hypothetical protein
MKKEELVDLIYEVTDLMPKVYDTLKKLDKVFVTDEEYEDGEDIIHESPRYAMVSKHGFYAEYVIIKIAKGGNISAKGLGEDHGDEIEITVDDLDYNEATDLLMSFN